MENNIVRCDETVTWWEDYNAILRLRHYRNINQLSWSEPQTQNFIITTLAAVKDPISKALKRSLKNLARLC